MNAQIRQRIGVGWVACLLGILVVWAPVISWSEPTETTLRRSTKTFLYVQGDHYDAKGEVPSDDTYDPHAEQTELRSFTASLKLGETGTQDIPAMHFECQGERYVLPTHKVIVLGPLSEEPGLSVKFSLDPNGTGNVEILLSYRAEKRGDDSVWINRNLLPNKVSVFDEGTSSSQSNTSYSWRMRMVLRNNSGATFTVKPELFKNLPEVKEWPQIEIEPVPSNEIFP